LKKRSKNRSKNFLAQKNFASVSPVDLLRTPQGGCGSVEEDGLELAPGTLCNKDPGELEHCG
jgi:hypothetical protein